MPLSRAIKVGVEELVAVWSFLQLSRIEVTDLHCHAPPAKVYLFVSCTFCCGLLLLVNVLAVQDFNAGGLRRALASSLIVCRPFPGLAAACEDPSHIAPCNM